MGGRQADQAVALAFFRAYAGSVLAIQRLARLQVVPSRAKVARTFSPLLRSGISPVSALTSAISAKVQTLVSWPNMHGF
jgi:hypothetical protein